MPAGPRAALAICGAGVFLAYLDLTVVNVALPTMARDLGAGVASASWAVTGYNVVYTALLVAAGRIADARGRRRTFATGLVVFAVGSALCAAAWDVPSLVAFRLLQAVGAAVLVPVSLALLLPAYPAARQGLAIGSWGALGAFAAGIGPPVGGLLTEIDWRLVFLVNLPVSALVLARVRTLAEPARGPARPLDRSGMALLAVGVAALVLAIVQAPAWGLGGPRTLALAALAVAAAVLLLLVERRAAAPVLDPRVLRVRAFALATGASALFYGAYFGYALLSVLAFQGAWHRSPLGAGLTYGPGPLISCALSPFAGTLVDRLGGRRVAVLGASLYLVVLAGLAVGLPASPGETTVLPLLAGGGIALALLFPALTRIATAALPAPDLAAGTGVFNTVRQVGGVLGIAVCVAIVGDLPRAIGPYRDAFAAMAVAQAAALALVLVLARGGTVRADA